eukprot:gnl/Hemi2/17165_TR5712_c0_g2_i1.p1 gnl/Hemi2/17165_TR5712_c0_g2~~gnl/Hemi2/17165_TR5712_c0_g2_i1.p1  ORF type:complete len:159 (+),score=47.48 gnl/Hemi2/17165_TR5712_c0_g2_i1:92-568(+)
MGNETASGCNSLFSSGPATQDLLGTLTPEDLLKTLHGRSFRTQFMDGRNDVTASVNLVDRSTAQLSYLFRSNDEATATTNADQFSFTESAEGNFSVVEGNLVVTASRERVKNETRYPKQPFVYRFSLTPDLKMIKYQPTSLKDDTRFGDAGFLSWVEA